jgi:hypothetical protein
MPPEDRDRTDMLIDGAGLRFNVIGLGSMARTGVVVACWRHLFELCSDCLQFPQLQFAQRAQSKIADTLSRAQGAVNR